MTVLTFVAKALILNSLLFAGEIFQYYMQMVRQSTTKWWDIDTIKNLFIAPLFEEFIYRVCMVNIMVESGSLDEFTAVLILPLFFAISHLHHELVTEEPYMKTKILRCLFKLAYTQIFGIMSGYAYIKTGSIWPAFTLHSHCNYFGFPNFGQLLNKEHRRSYRIITGFLYAAGLWVYIYYFSEVFSGVTPWWNE